MKDNDEQEKYILKYYTTYKPEYEFNPYVDIEHIIMVTEVTPIQ